MRFVFAAILYKHITFNLRVTDRVLCRGRVQLRKIRRNHLPYVVTCLRTYGRKKMCLIPVPNQSMNTSVKFLTYNCMCTSAVLRGRRRPKKRRTLLSCWLFAVLVKLNLNCLYNTAIIDS